MTDKLRKENIVSKFDTNMESYISVDNEDNFIDVVDPKNMPGKIILVYKGCELLGVWHWESDMGETLEDAIEMLFVNNLQED